MEDDDISIIPQTRPPPPIVDLTGEDSDSSAGEGDLAPGAPAEIIPVHRNFVTKCQKCGRPFRSNGDLEKHTSSKGNCAIRHWFGCSLCGWSAMYRSQIRKHLAVKHPIIRFDQRDHFIKEEKPTYRCGLCLVRCRDRSELSRHTQSVHGKKKK